MSEKYSNKSFKGHITEQVPEIIGLPSNDFIGNIKLLSPSEKMVYKGIFLKLSVGNKVTGTDLILLGERLRIDIEDPLKHLSELDLVQIDKLSGNVTVAYPFSGVPTHHIVRLKGKNPAFAMCAIDALGVSAMFEEETEITSQCLHCGEKIHINVKNDVPVSNPKNIVINIGRMKNVDNCCSEESISSFDTSFCPMVQFFCSHEHLNQYTNERSINEGVKLSLPKAYAVASDIFGPLMKSLKNEMYASFQTDRLILQSDRFLCIYCEQRVIDLLKGEPGVKDITKGDKNELIINITSQSIINKVVEEAKIGLESDPHNPFPVKVNYL